MKPLKWSRAWRFFSVLLVVGTLAQGAEKVHLGDPGQFRITRLKFSTNGSLEVSKPTPTFFYGQPLNNIVPSTNEQGDFQMTSKGPPVRPALRYDISHWTQENGLPATRVRTLLQAHDGYLWVGT